MYVYIPRSIQLENQATRKWIFHNETVRERYILQLPNSPFLSYKHLNTYLRKFNAILNKIQMQNLENIKSAKCSGSISI